MRRQGAFEVPYAGQERYEREGKPLATEPGADTGGKVGFRTPSGRLEVYSGTLAAWGHPEQAVPGYVRSQVHWRNLDATSGEMVLLPTFRLPTLIHTRSGNAKWLQEISHTNPLWVHPEDAARLGLENGGLARVATRIGHFVPRVWVTEGIRPGVVACSHHLGRWRLFADVGGARASSALVSLERKDGTFLFRRREGARSFASADPDTRRMEREDVGVNQNLTFPVQPDPVSGMHCWHQKVVVGPAAAGDRHGDVFVDTRRSRRVFEEWLALARPGPGPGGLRRPTWLNRPLHPAPEAWRV
jgi:anaerobic selenocysteine-containing dehydrogenase